MAQKAEEEFDKVFRNKELPSDISEFVVSKKNYSILDLLFESGLASSKKEAKRLVEGNAVELINGEKKEKIANWNNEIELNDMY